LGDCAFGRGKPWFRSSHGDNDRAILAELRDGSQSDVTQVELAKTIFVAPAEAANTA